MFLNFTLFNKVSFINNFFFDNPFNLSAAGVGATWAEALVKVKIDTNKQALREVKGLKLLNLLRRFATRIDGQVNKTVKIIIEVLKLKA